MSLYTAVIEQSAVTIQSEVFFKNDPQRWAPLQFAISRFPAMGGNLSKILDNLRLRISHQGEPAFVKADGGWVFAARFELKSMPGKGVPQGLDIGIARLLGELEKLGLDVQDERTKKYKVRWQEPQEGDGGMMDMQPGQWVLED